MPSHYLNQCWNIVNLNLRNKLQWNLKAKFVHLKKMHFKKLFTEWQQIFLGLNVSMFHAPSINTLWYGSHWCFMHGVTALYDVADWYNLNNSCFHFIIWLSLVPVALWTFNFLSATDVSWHYLLSLHNMAVSVVWYIIYEGFILCVLLMFDTLWPQSLMFDTSSMKASYCVCYWCLIHYDFIHWCLIHHLWRLHTVSATDVWYIIYEGSILCLLLMFDTSSMKAS